MSDCTHTWKREHYQRCPQCEGDRNRARLEELREAITAFKASTQETLDKHLVRRLRELGHPDVDALVAWKAGS